jgi:fructokinase
MRIGTDLGGTKMEALALSDCGSELVRHRFQTPRNDYAATWKALTDLVHFIEEQTNEQKGSIGLGIPGCISRTTGVVKNCNCTWINGQALDRDLSTLLGVKFASKMVRIVSPSPKLMVLPTSEKAGRSEGSGKEARHS